MQKQPSIPMIIAVEHHSSQTTSGEVAAKLANYLKYTLLNPDDFAPTLQGYHASSSNQAPSAISQDLDDLSFKHVYEIASSKLRSKLGVVINLSLSNHTHFDKLKQLASSHGVELLLVQCGSRNEIVDAVGVRKLTVESTGNPFDAASCISANFGQTFPQSSDLQQEIVKPAETNRHLHSLIFYNKQPTNDAPGLCCKSCHDSVSGPNYYKCVVCDEYIFHKSCAEEPGDLQNIRDTCPRSLVSQEPKYDFQEKRWCKLCKDFSYDCHDCLFETTITGKFLPVVINREAHLHPLNLIIMPLSYNYEFGCCGCGHFGNSMSYRCYNCNFNLHVSCVLLEQKIRTTIHSHPLRLVYDSIEENFGDQSYCCDFCKLQMDPEQWFYSCTPCKFVAHIGCAGKFAVNPSNKS